MGEPQFTLTGKQKRYLRSLGNEMDPIIFVGKNDINENLIKQLEDALVARELIKVRVLKTSNMTVDEVAEELSLDTSSEIVQIIGQNFLLYRMNQKEPRIVLP